MFKIYLECFCIFIPSIPCDKNLAYFDLLRTFNQSWIPENAIQRDHADATGERPEKSTAIYAFGHAILIVTKKLIGIFNTCSMTALLWTQNSIAFVMNTAFSVIVFTARSLLCSVVSVLIVLLHMLQVQKIKIHFPHFTQQITSNFRGWDLSLISQYPKCILTRISPYPQFPLSLISTSPL